VFPPGFALVLFTIQPDYMKVLFQNGIGVIAVIVSAVMAAIGFFWLRRMMTIEV
jgi:Flp pilus assembly protein TadB